jgi:dUTPase
VSIAPGDRRAQGIIIPFVRAELTEATPDGPRASRGGFGATD